MQLSKPVQEELLASVVGQVSNHGMFSLLQQLK